MDLETTTKLVTLGIEFLVLIAGFFGTQLLRKNNIATDLKITENQSKVITQLATAALMQFISQGGAVKGLDDTNAKKEVALLLGDNIQQSPNKLNPINFDLIKEVETLWPFLINKAASYTKPSEEQTTII